MTGLEDGSPSFEALGLLRVAVHAPEVVVADVAANVARSIESAERVAQRGVRLLVLPELGITGYTCADLFFQEKLRRAALRGLRQIAAATEQLPLAIVAGLPVEVGGRLYNCAALAAGGRVVGIVPKTFLPTSREYYESRWFATGGNVAPGSTVAWQGERVPFGTDLLFAFPDPAGCVVGIEICEDLWSVQPPSSAMALAGATVLVNPSASNELLGKIHYRRSLVQQQSARCLAAYLYAGAGPGESSTDLVFSGHCMAAEYGVMLAESERFVFAAEPVVADVDVERLLLERLHNSSFAQAAGGGYRELQVPLPAAATMPTELLRPLHANPFVPADAAGRRETCEEIFALQATGLAKRLRHLYLERLTIGVSGGLDSTLALLVAVAAFDKLGIDRRGIQAITMPGFGTTERTKGNAEKLAEALGASLSVVPIAAAVRQHFRDIGHDESVHDVTYENAQARERTQILMDLANRGGGLVLGTGDMSELALGWCTFNGDHMSMYHVNAGVPKTLVRYIVEWFADEQADAATAAVLRDVCATPITPELLPLDESGRQNQDTEATVGPYELHDFFLYHTVRLPFSPRKVYYLAKLAWGHRYDDATLRRWLAVFYRRFFAQQFKRSAMPDGPKIGTVALSPRGDWRMPSDASAAAWLAEVESIGAEPGAAPPPAARPRSRKARR